MKRYSLRVSWYGRISLIVIWAIDYPQLLTRFRQDYPGAKLIRVEGVR